MNLPGFGQRMKIFYDRKMKVFHWPSKSLQLKPIERVVVSCPKMFCDESDGFGALLRVGIFMHCGVFLHAFFYFRCFYYQ